MINFGSGKVIAVPTNMADGSVIANPTPVQIASLQDVSIDLSVEIKALYGAKRYPIAIGQGKGKIEIKAKYAEIDGGMLGSLYYGKAAAAGIKAAVFDSAAAIPTATPWQLTVTPPNAGQFVSDLGVQRTDIGVQMTRVDISATPTTGQYKVSPAGVYTFATADANKPVAISYEYSAASGGQIWTLTNDIMGTTPSFTMMFQNGYDGKNLVCRLNRCVSGKLALPFKSDDFGVYDFDAQAFADRADQIGYLCLF